MPIKATWKSIFGVLATLAGPVLATNVHAFPASVAAGLTVVGGLIVAAERLADSKDFATVAGPGAVNEVAKVKADFSAELDRANAELSRLRPIASSYQALVDQVRNLPAQTPLETLAQAPLLPTPPNAPS